MGFIGVRLLEQKERILFHWVVVNITFSIEDNIIQYSTYSSNNIR